MRVLIKIGTGVIGPGSQLDRPWLRGKVAEIAALLCRGDEILLVSSGAVAAGMEVVGRTERPGDPLELQMLSGIGQIPLATCYQELFREHGVQVAQVLLTHYNFDTPREERTILRILDSYLSRGMVPVINENDLVNKEEFDVRGHFTDNDILAALVATHVRPDLAVILTNVDGLHAGGAHGPLIPVVERVDDDVRAHASCEASPLGLGGMLSKVDAAAMMTAQGIDVIVGNGNAALEPLIDGSVPRTLFRAQRRSAARGPSAAMARA